MEYFIGFLLSFCVGIAFFILLLLIHNLRESRMTKQKEKEFRLSHDNSSLVGALPLRKSGARKNAHLSKLYSSVLSNGSASAGELSKLGISEELE
jgi:hypothetical protein